MRQAGTTIIIILIINECWSLPKDATVERKEEREIVFKAEHLKYTQKKKNKVGRALSPFLVVICFQDMDALQHTPHCEAFLSLHTLQAEGLADLFLLQQQVKSALM